MSTQPATPAPNRLGSTLGTRRDWRRRLLLHHLPLALASAAVLVLFMSLPLFDANRYRHVDIFTAAFPQPRTDSTPMTGPMQHGGGQPGAVQHGGGQPGQPQHGGGQPGTVQHSSGQTSSSAAVFSVVHVIYGLQAHGQDLLRNLRSYFLAPDGSPLVNSFGPGNWTGLAATVIVVGLLAISSDLALRKLKARSWKRIQRLPGCSASRRNQPWGRRPPLRPRAAPSKRRCSSRPCGAPCATSCCRS